MKITETETTLSVDTDTMRRVTVARHQADGSPTDLFLTIRALDGPRDQEHGSVKLTAQQAEPIAHALLGIDDHHDLDAYASRVMAKHRRDCHSGNVDGDCMACSIAYGAGTAYTLSDLAALRARWANETQPYDRGGLLPTHYRVEADGTVTDNDPNRYTGWHVTTGGKAPDWTSAHQTILRLARERDDALDRERQAVADRDGIEVKIDERYAEINDLRATLNDALARADRAEGRLARLRDAYSDLVADTRRNAVDTVYAVTEEDVDDEEVTMHVTATAQETTREYRTSRRTVGPGETPDRLRESIRYHLQSVAELEAVARAMGEDGNE